MNDLSGRSWPGNLIFLLLLLIAPGDARAQAVDLGGRAFIDYFYQLSSPDEDIEGLHGFLYRRLYLTADATLSDAFRSRARLEANDGTTGEKGPEPFVKDLWLAWDYSGEHSATLGVMKPPHYDVAEDVWGYRSLEKMALDFYGINSSRDFGIRFDGPIGANGSVRYAAMLANNSAAKPETDPYKRGYAMLSFYPGDALVFYVSADRAGYDDARESGTRVSVFAGYDGERARLGAEGFWSSVEFTADETLRHTGVSLFAAYRLTPRLEVLARSDFVNAEQAAKIDQMFLLAGLAYSPIESVRIIPNLWFLDSEAADDPEALGRLTVDLTF